MKKNLMLMLVVLAIAGTFVTGCSGADAKKETEKIESEVKEDAEKVEGLGSEFAAKLQSDLITIEAAAAKDIEAGEKDLETIKTEVAAELEKVKATVEADAGDAKEESLKLIKDAEERLEGLFNK